MKTMYGTLDAAERWAAHYTQVLEAAGFTVGKASPCHFYDAARDTWVLVHGDNFVIVGRRDGREFEPGHQAPSRLRWRYTRSVEKVSSSQLGMWTRLRCGAWHTCIAERPSCMVMGGR